MSAKMDQPTYRLKNIIIVLGLFVFALLALVASLGIDGWFSQFLQSISQTVMVGAILGFAYELFLREEVIRIFREGNEGLVERHDKLAEQFTLSGSCSKIGLSEVHVAESGFDYADIISNSQELTFVFNDGRTWFSRHEADLSDRLARPDRSTTVIIAHPNSSFLPILAEKVEADVEGLARKIEESARMLKRNAKNNHRLKIFGHNFPTSYSAIISENFGVFIPYPMARKEDKIPCFVFTSDVESSFYHILKRDIDTLVARASRRIFDSEIHENDLKQSRLL